MFSMFKKDPVKELNKKYNDLLQQALEAQRRGDIRSYSSLTTKAEGIAKELDRLTSES